jgi:hypothetical protein
MPQYLGAPPDGIASPGPVNALGEPTCAPGGCDRGVCAGAEDRAQTRPQAGCADPAPLPRLPCNNSIETRGEFGPAVAKTAFALQVNVQEAVGRWGLERTGFLTLTFADHVTDPREAQRRMNSLTTNVLRPRYGEAIRVMERQESGRIHYHLLIKLGVDIRTGFDFDAIKKRDYRSASAALRAEWAFWRRTAKLYGFGRTELLPIKSTAEGVGRYVGKYISKHFRVREEADKGVRLVSYIGPRVATVKFAWAGPRGRAWREALGALVRDLAAMKQIDAASVEAMRRRYGKNWAWNWRDIVAQRAAVAEVPDYQVTELPMHEGVPIFLARKREKRKLRPSCNLNVRRI